MMSDKSAVSKGRRKKTTLFRGGGVTLLDRQWGAWGLLICLALAMGLALLTAGQAFASIVEDFSSSGDVDEGSGAVVGFLRLVFALAWGLAVGWAARRLYHTLQARSRLRLRLFTALASGVSLVALAFYSLTDRVLFYSAPVTVGYLSFLTFFALWGFSANRSAR